MGVKFRAPTELFPIQAGECSSLTLPPQPQVSCTHQGSQGLSLLLQGQVGFQKMRAQCKVVEGALFLYIRGNLFAIRAPKLWTKEAGQSFSEDKFKSREDKCVQTGPTPPVQKERGHLNALSRGLYRRYFQYLFKQYKDKNTHSENSKLTSSRDISIICSS